MPRESKDELWASATARAERALRVRAASNLRSPSAHAQAAVIAITETPDAKALLVGSAVERLRRDPEPSFVRTCEQVFSPAAEFVGLGALSRELADEALAVSRPEEYARLSRFALEVQGGHARVVDELVATVRQELQYFGVDATVEGRVKNLASIHRKLAGRREPVIHDVYGLRVIVSSTEDCYRALGVIHLAFSPLPERFRDYVAAPKPSGYQSLHTVVRALNHPAPVELQIRSREMHAAAERGQHSHFSYRYGASLTRALDSERWVYPLTPAGEVRRLPRGATALDFAYAIHSDLGRGFRAAHVDGRLAHATTALQSGETVVIVHRAWSTVAPGQLGRVRTARARNCIRSQLLR